MKAFLGKKGFAFQVLGVSFDDIRDGTGVCGYRPRQLHCPDF